MAREKPDTADAVRNYKKFLRRTTALGTAVGMYFAWPYIDMATDSYDLPPMPDCASHSSAIAGETVDAPALHGQVMSQILNDPASKEALVMQAILSKGGTNGRMNAMLGHDLGLPVETHKSDESKAYDESCAYRGVLLDVDMYNPLLIGKVPTYQGKENPDNFLHFKAIANYEDKPSANKAVAYYQPETQTLLIGTVGLTHDENNDRAIAAITGNADRLIPYEFADKFIGELRDQLRGQGLKVQNTAIFSHSLGTSGGVLMKAMLETSKANQIVFGKNPSLTIVEGFGESFAANEVGKKFDIPQDKLRQNVTSVRSGGNGTATIVASEWDNNKTIGTEVYSITAVEDEENHELAGIIKGIMNGTRTITPYKGTFRTDGKELVEGQGLQFVGKLAKMGREVRQHTGLG